MMNQTVPLVSCDLCKVEAGVLQGQAQSRVTCNKSRSPERTKCGYIFQLQSLYENNMLGKYMFKNQALLY